MIRLAQNMSRPILASFQRVRHTLVLTMCVLHLNVFLLWVVIPCYITTLGSEAAQAWGHGDLIEVTPSGGIVVKGRSDSTLNPGGAR